MHSRASLASIPERVESLERTVRSLLPQVDRVGVYLNGYDGVPAFLDHPRVDVARSQEYGDPGDAGKFFWAGDSDYALSCDDDLVYPPGYAAYLIASVERYWHRAIVGLHGYRFKRSFETIYDSYAQLYRALDGTERDHAVNVLGTGCMAWHRSVGLDSAWFRSPNMADLWLAGAAQERRIPLIALKHRKSYLEHTKHSRTIFRQSRDHTGSTFDSSAGQHKIVHAYDWRLNAPPRTRIVISIITFNRRRALRLLLGDLERERARFDAESEVRIYDDYSPGYEAIEHLAAERGYVYQRAPDHRGRPDHWRLVADELADLESTLADWYVFLPDDVRLCDHFFARALAVWETLEEPTALNLAHHLSRPGACWTKQRPLELGDGVEVGWVDGLYLTRRDALESIDFTVDSPAERWLEKRRGSGTGALLSRELLRFGARLYRVKRSLVTMQNCPSKMNGKIRKTDPQTAVDPVDSLPDGVSLYRVGRARIAASRSDHIGKVIAKGEWYERDLLDTIKDARVSGTFVDVGAHVGNHTAYFALECGAERVIAIEPNAETYVLLRATVEASGLADRVACIRAAVHPTWRTARVVPGPAGNSGMAGAAEDIEGTVPVVTLDELLWNEKVAVVKIDVEGLAVEAVRSGLGVIERDHPLLAIEASNDERDAISALLAPFRYAEPSGPYACTPVWLWGA